MASKYTEHYGLCQWEPGDSFIRSEFNADNAKVDAALRWMESGIVHVSGNVYNLMLQSYYDGKQTGYKKALVFDGFMDGSMVETMSPGLLRRDNKVILYRPGRGNVEMGAYGNAVDATSGIESPVFIGQGLELLTGVTVKTAQAAGTPEDGLITLRIYINGIEAQKFQLILTFGSPKEQVIPFGPVEVKPGESYIVRLYTSRPNHQFYITRENKIAGRLMATASGGTEGCLLTHMIDLPERGSLRAWARYTGGQVALSVRSGGGVFPLTRKASRSALNLQGQPCIESEYVLTSVPSGPLTFGVNLTLGEGASMELYDYGAALL